MATSPQKPASGTFRDPFGKWQDGSTRGVQALVKNAREEKEALTKAMSKVQALKASMGALSGHEAQVAKKLLVEATRELAATQKLQRKSALNSSNLTALQVDTASKLNQLKQWMAQSQLSPQEKKRAAFMQKTLEKVLGDLSSSNIGQVDFKAVEQSLEAIQVSQAALPEELGERFAATEEALEDIKRRQEEAQKFLAEHREMLRNFGSRILQGLGRGAMNLADRVGVGPLTLGNAFRGVGAVAKGVGATARFGARVWKGETYVQKYLKAKRDARSESPGGDDDSMSSRLVDAIKKMGASNTWFQRRLLREVEKQGKDKKTSSGSIFGRLGTMLSSLMGSVSTFFGSGGFLKTVAYVGRWLAPLAAAGKFMLTRAMPVIGAFLGGWKVGSMIYEKYATQIGDAIDNTIGALKSAYDWVANKIGGVKDWAVGAYNTGKDAIVGGAKSLYGKALSAADTVGQAVTSAGGAVMSAGQSAISNVKTAAGQAADFATTTGRSIAQSAPVQAATSAAVGAYKVGEAAGSYIKQGVSKLSDLVGSVITKGANVDLDGLTPGMQGSLGGMAQDYFIATGKKLQFNSGMRSEEEQTRLYKTMPAGMAAAPGSSLHNYGLAADIQSAQANELQQLGLLDKYGFTRPVKNEPWHVQPQGMSLAAAKAGIYSADAPADQARVSAAPVQQTVSTSSPLPSGGNQVPSMGPGGPRNKTATAGSKPVGLNDIPTLDMTDGVFLALNLGVIR